ncbi:mutator type transposase [Tanacetum coccineum]
MLDRCNIMPVVCGAPHLISLNHLGDSEEVEETFDPFFCDLDPESSQPHTTEIPNVSEPTKIPNVANQTEYPNDVENRDEHSDGGQESEDRDGHSDGGEKRPNDFPAENTQPVEDEVFEDLDLEDFDSGSDPDDVENNRKKALRMLARKHKPVDGNIYSENFYCGQTFPNKEMIKKMVSKISVENRRQLWITKNDKVRVRAQCRGIVPTFSNEDGSQFGSNGSSGSNGKSKMEKTKKVDSQSQSTTNKDKAGKPKVNMKDFPILSMGSNTVHSKKMEEKTIKPNPKIPIAALKDQLQKKFELGVSRAKVIRAKQMAEDNVIGDYANQYARLKDYCLELQEQNPDTTIKIDVERDYDDNKTAVGVDPNNGTYPLAYAVVETETKESWTWFLDCLGDDLQLARNSNFTFITDRQKGLVPALQEMFPAAEHRYCLKHIYDNMKLSWRGQQYKELLWKSATSPTLQLFERNMEELRSLNKEVYDWLKGIPPHHWARSHFSVIVQQLISKSNGPLTPNATKIFNNIKKEAAQITVLWNGGDLYQATGPHVACIGIWQAMVKKPGRPPKKRKKSAAELYDGMVKKGQRGPTVNESQANANASASARNLGQCANASARPTVNQSQASQASVNPSAPTASQSQTFVRPTLSLIPTKPSVMNTLHF